MEKSYKPTISFIVPALNEEKNIELAVQQILIAAQDRFSDYEILLVDDGSTDTTGYIMENMAAQNNKIHVIHNQRNLGFGGAYKCGLAAAKFDYVMMVTGDNESHVEGIKGVLSAIGKADIVMAYVINPHVRSYLRRFISSGYTTLINLLFGLQVRYYNGYTIHRADLLRQISITSDGFGFNAEILIKLLKRGNSYVEVSTTLNKRKAGKTKIFMPKNLLSVMRTILHLVWVVYFQGQKAASCNNYE